MVTFFLAFLAVTLFCVCSRQFIKTVVNPIPVYNQSNFSKSALRIEKVYFSIAWGLMTAIFLMGLVVSFYQVYNEL